MSTAEDQVSDGVMVIREGQTDDNDAIITDSRTLWQDVHRLSYFWSLIYTYLFLTKKC